MKEKRSIITAIVVVMITVSSVWYAQRPVAPKQASWGDIITESRAGGYQIISTDELADLYHDSSRPQVLIDTRQDWEYRTGHMESAVNFPMEPTWWSRWRKARTLEDFLGPDKEQLLVFY
ncbi:MAG: rhodanese-like domain-containing protein [Deltaproteobacteria bacterium]|nr:rhodanese-like domain-containing protein [Deltaproteobacteria bacterium]MBW2658794.1 rhodanese-like domain-containing protein [Deltaproteobacteria bacterium]